MTTRPLLESLSDDELIAETKRLVAAEHIATAALLRSLMEIDARRLYLREGCSSLFTYCTQVLHLAEGAAYNRIEAARAARRFPAVLDALAGGRITLTTIRLLAPHLTDDNHGELIAAARHKSKRDVELLIAATIPKPPAPAMIRRVLAPLSTREQARTMGCIPIPSPPSLPQSRHEAPPASARSGTLSVLTVDSYKLQVTISRETQEKLRRAQDLFRHTNPSGDLTTLLDRALTLLLADLERRRCAATPAPRTSAPGTSSGRYIPAAVRREVWQRDQGRCAFVGASGRCRETAFLEFHHVEPLAEGGQATVTNIQLRCKAHNLYEASLFFGGADCGREPAMTFASPATPNSFQNELERTTPAAGQRPSTRSG
jgi:5-methylcytosine-specific restriction endonuclease McrA